MSVDISKIVLPNGTECTLKDADARKVWYGTCPTGASTQAKIVTTTSENFVLAEGNIVFVKFTNAQTYNGTATLTVDGQTATNVCSVGATTTTRYYWKAGEVVGFVYDGTNFVMVEKAPATTTYYGITKLSDSTTSTSSALAATPKAVKTAYDLADGKQDLLVSGTNIKTINNESILGSGNIDISGGGGNSASAIKRTGASSGSKTLSTSYQQINLTVTSWTEGTGFEVASNGIKCLEAGLVHITAKVRVGDGYTANDYINARVYNSTQATSLLAGRIRTPFQAYNTDMVLDGYAIVNANDVLIIQANNETGSRGNITYATTMMTVACASMGSSGGGGGVTDFVDLAFDPSDYTDENFFSELPEDLQFEFTELVSDTPSFVGWLFHALVSAHS